MATMESVRLMLNPLLLLSLAMAAMEAMVVMVVMVMVPMDMVDMATGHMDTTRELLTLNLPMAMDMDMGMEDTAMEVAMVMDITRDQLMLSPVMATGMAMEDMAMEAMDTAEDMDTIENIEQQIRLKSSEAELFYSN